MPPSMPQRWLVTGASPARLVVPLELDGTDAHAVAWHHAGLDQLALHAQSGEVALEALGGLGIFEIRLCREPLDAPANHSVCAVFVADREDIRARLEAMHDDTRRFTRLAQGCGVRQQPCERLDEVIDPLALLS